MPRVTRHVAATGLAAILGLTGVAPAAARTARPAPSPAKPSDPRHSEPMVITGADLHDWSEAAAVGVAKPYPSGAAITGDGVRDAHNGVLTQPPDPRNGHGVDVHHIAAFRWDGRRFVEVPVQVDQRFPYFLANGQSSFSTYSGTDEELTYRWDTESWRKTAGGCDATYPSPLDRPTAGPSGDRLGDNDEISFMASDAGRAAPATAGAPRTASGAGRYEITVVDPTAPGGRRYLYLFQAPPSFNATNGYVHYQRAADADHWIDSKSFAPGDPEALGLSNTGYGPHLAGTVCDPGQPARQSTKRWVKDGVAVTTPTYAWTASGRWMIRGLQVSTPAAPASYGPSLIDRWKGRAFRLSPDEARAAGPLDVGGFEDEQTNWEANSALLGERAGPVRAIREVWGSDSGTNVTKTETFYRDAITYRYHLRVHPIPPDGLYAYWNYRPDVATRYYDPLLPSGVAIDGHPDGSNLAAATAGTPLATDVSDPTFGIDSVLLNWSQVSGRGRSGSLVYATEVKRATSLENPVVEPFYRDDACYDDGTGSSPVPRPWPGRPSDDPAVRAGYSAENGNVPYSSLTCAQRDGLWGAHGFHVAFSGDTDNAFSPKPVTEADVQEWQFAVPTPRPENIGAGYAQTVRSPLVAVAQLRHN